MLQQTFEALEQSFLSESDASIDAAKGVVECACRVLIEERDDPKDPKKPAKSDASLSELLGLATRMLKLGEIRHRAFSDLIREHNRLADSLRVLRNEAGTVSHGKDGFIAKLSRHHRRAAVLAADAIVTFLHEAYLEREPDPVRTLEPFDRFTESNDLIDKYTSIVVDPEDNDETDGMLRVRIILPNDDEIPLILEPARLLFSIDRTAYKSAQAACRDAAVNRQIGDVEDA